MQRLVVFLSVISILFISCNSETKKEINRKGYIINGVLPATNSSLIYLLNNQNVKIDSSKITNNTFLFNGLLLNPEIHSIQLKDQSKKYAIVLENSTYNVYLDNEEMTILGGPLNTKQARFNALKSDLNAKKLALLDTFMLGGMKSDILSKSIKAIDTAYKNNVIEYIIENADNALSPTLFSSIKIFSLEELKTLNSNSNITATTPLKSILSNEITRLQKISDTQLAEEKRIAAAKKAYRKPAIMFSGDGINRELISLKSIVKGKKVVLIDFWASWCGPCRMTTPKVRQLYKKYKNKGFTILTVSEDKNREAWKQGITQDNMLSWHHIFDDYGRISSMYGVRAIPYMVLIDGNGGIIKEKISMSELEYQLQKLL